jgi:hypothetical protein
MILLRCVGHRSRNKEIFNSGHRICLIPSNRVDLYKRSVLCFKKILQQMAGQKTNPVYSIEYGYENITHTRLGLGLSSMSYTK